MDVHAHYNDLNSPEHKKRIQQTWGIIIPLGLLIINCIVKGLFISYNSLCGDEPFSVYHAQMSIPSIIYELSQGNNPPLYEIILHYWINLFGISELSVRIPSLLFSCVTLIYIYKTGNRFFTPKAGVTAAMIFIFSEYQIGLAQEARCYMFMAMLISISMYRYMKMLSGSGIRKNVIILIITNTLLIYTHYFGCFIFVVQLGTLFLGNIYYRKYIKHLFLVSFVSVILFLPNIWVFYKRIHHTSTAGTWIKPPGGITDLYNLLWTFCNAPVVTVIVITLLLLGIFQFILQKKNISMNKLILITWFAVPIFSTFVGSFFVPLFIPRYLMISSLGLILLVSVTATHLFRKKILRYLISMILIGLFVCTARIPLNRHRNIRELVRVSIGLQGEGAILVYPYRCIIDYSYYYDQNIFRKVHSPDIYVNLNKELTSHHVFGFDNLQQVSYHDWSKLIFVDAGLDPAGKSILDILVKDYDLIDTKEIDKGYFIYELKKK